MCIINKSSIRTSGTEVIYFILYHYVTFGEELYLIIEYDNFLITCFDEKLNYSTLKREDSLK